MNLKTQVLAINRLLSDIYKREMRLSYLLAESDFGNPEIELVNQKLLPNTVACFLNVIEKTIVDSKDGIRAFRIIEDTYGLTGDRSKTLRQVGIELNISHERVRQLKNRIIRRLALDRGELSWKLEFAKAIRQLLKNYRDCATLNTKKLNYASKYGFEPSVLPTGEKVLKIVDENNEITIFQSDFEDFHNSFLKQIRLLGWENSRGDSIKEIRKTYARAYEKWTIEEENWLKSYLAEGLSIKEIAEILERQPGAISSRITKLT